MQLRGKLNRDEIKKRATLLLKEVGLGERMDHFPNMLSGGE
jgi:predicted ABC-type transport system involved in lysophospholipase L1 biosynthesis ATPase subunit